MKRIPFIVILMLITRLLWAQSSLDRAYQLYDEGKYGEGLTIVDSLLTAEGESRQILRARYYMLDGMGKYQEALESALAAERVHERKSPWDCILITEAYLKLNDQKKGLDWFEKATNRGFISYQSLPDSVYKVFQGNVRFENLLQTIKDRISIGKPAKEFSLELLDGKIWKLSDQKGKVVLVDFFATWCRPCRDEMVNLKNIYSLHRESPFD